MNKKNIKQFKKSSKKDLTKYSLLKSIIKNLERDYLSLAFSIWADPVPKEESENIFIDYYNSKKYKTNIKKYANEQEESLNGEYNFISNKKELENKLKNHRKQHINEYEKNTIKRMIKNENENKLKGSYNSLRSNKSENIYKKKEIKKSKMNRNIIPNTYKIKLSDIQNNNKTEIIEPYSKKQNEGRRVSALLDISDEKENTEIDNEEKSNDKSKNNRLKKEVKFRTIKENNDQEFNLMNIKNRNSSEVERKVGTNKYKKLFFSVDAENINDLNKNYIRDLMPLKRVINNMQLRFSKFAKLYFDKWHIEAINYKNGRKNNSKKDAYLVNYKVDINEKQNEDIDNQRKHNIDRKYKKQFKSTISPLGNHNKINEDINNSHSSKEIKPYISKRNKRKKNNTTNFEEENILFYSKETPVNTEPNVISPPSLQKSQDSNLKLKKKKKLVKKQEPNLTIITPFTFVDDPTNSMKENIKIQKSHDNLSNFYDFVPPKSKSSKNKKENENSFVNKYFKSRDINYAKEDINPDVMDIQIRQEKETETEKTKNLTKMLKTGLHLLRKVIRSFQKRKTKGSSKDILKIYFNKWRIIIEKIPTRYNTEIYPFDKEKEELYNEHLKTEPLYKNNTKSSYNNINLVKKIKNFNKINLVDSYNTQIELNLKKDSKNILESDEDFHDNKIITKTLGVPNSDRGSMSSRKELKVDKSTQNRHKVSRNTSMNEFNLAHSYDIINPKDNKLHRSKRKSKAKNKIYNIIIKLIKKNEDNLLYKYFIRWYNKMLNSFDYNHHHSKYKSKHNTSKKNLIRISQDKEKNINKEEDENRLSTDYKNRKSKKHSVEKRNDLKQSIKIYKDLKDNKKKKDNEKYNNGVFEIKNEFKKSMSLNNNVLNLINICGNGNESLSSINNYLKLIQYQNKLIAAYQIYSFYFYNNHYIKLIRYYFYKWLKHNKIFKNSTKQENHIISKNNHCINCNCFRNHINLNCIDCHCNKIKKVLKKILIRHIYMKKINLRKYYLYLWYKKSFKTIRKI